MAMENPPPRRLAWLGHPLAWMLAAASVCLLGLALAIVLTGGQDRRKAALRPQPWERDLVPRVSAIKLQAEALARDGDARAAHALYRQIQQLVGGRAIHDPALWDLVERARQDQEKLFAAILRDVERLLVGDGPATAPATAPAEALPAGYANFDKPPADDPPAMVATSGTAPAAVAVAPSTQPGPATRALAAAPTTGPRMLASGHMLAPRPARPAAGSDEQIDAAVRRGVAWLLTQFGAEELKHEQRINDVYDDGLNALCLFALLECGRAIPDSRLDPADARMKQWLAAMKKQPLENDPAVAAAGPATYARSLRAAALAVHNRPEDREVLLADVAWLVGAMLNGAYTYNDEWARDPNRVEPRPLNPFIESPVLTPEGRRLLGDGPVWWHFDSSRAQRAWMHGSFVPSKPPILVRIPQVRPPAVHQPEPQVPPTPPPGDRYLPQTTAAPTGGYVEPDTRRLGERDPLNLPTRGPVPWDNSNAQFGVMGVAAGAEAGFEIPPDYWRQVESHWSRTQHPSGEWGYSEQHPQPSLSMTAGGAASLLAVHQWLNAPRMTQPGREAFSSSLLSAARWLDRENNCLSVAGGKVHYLGYNLFALQRAAQAAGARRLGGHDWQRTLARKVLAIQHPNGAWGKTDSGIAARIDTAFCLLFLARGRQPVLVNKLRFDGAWASRSLDAANLARFCAAELGEGRAFRSQTVSADQDAEDLCEAPVLLIASHQFPRLKDAEVARIRHYALAGGLVLTHAEGAPEPMGRFAAQLASRLFPAWEMKDLPAEHPLYTLHYRIAAPRPKLRAVSNGSRILMIHSPADLGAAWQTSAYNEHRTAFQLGVNILVYAGAKADRRGQPSSPTLATPAGAGGAAVTVARLKHAGNWDPEPAAWDRFCRYFQVRTGIALQPVAVDAHALAPGAAHLAHLTGAGAFALSDRDAAALRLYIQSGGVVLIDGCGGGSQFAQSAQAMLAAAFPAARLEPLGQGHPLLRGGSVGMDELSRPSLRPYAREQLGNAAGGLRALRSGRGCVVYSDLDLTTGLLGTHTWGILGYEPDWCAAMVKNIILWSLDGARHP